MPGTFLAPQGRRPDRGLVTGVLIVSLSFESGFTCMPFESQKIRNRRDRLNFNKCFTQKVCRHKFKQFDGLLLLQTNPHTCDEESFCGAD